MKALSFRQPWAELIIRGIKDVENRTWDTTYRGPLVVHAGSNLATFDEDDEIDKRLLRLMASHVPDRRLLDRGGIVGVVDLVDIVEDSKSPWAEPDCYHWLLANPRRVPFRSLKGKLGFFDVTL